MAGQGRPSFSKRQKEAARRAAKKRKEEKREQRKAEKATKPGGDVGEDPDIAGIVPGPQPLPYDLDPVEEDEASAEES